MPELPEVHTTVESLKKLVLEKTIKDVWSDFHIDTAHGHRNNLKNLNHYKDFKNKVVGTKIVNIERLGKNILIHLKKISLDKPKSKNNLQGQSLEYTIVVHMKMTGHLLFGTYQKTNYKYEIRNPKQIRKSKIINTKMKQTEKWVTVNDGPLKDSYNQFIHFVLTLTDKNKKERHLVLSDMRKFASVCLVETNKLKDHEGLSLLGPDPLLMSKKEFIDRFISFAKRKSAPIKTFLLDQSFVAGIGNIYADETLWASGVHPLSNPNKIPRITIDKIYGKINTILKKSISLGGDSMSDYRNPYGEKGGFQNCHNVYRRIGKNCPKPKCKGIIERTVIGGRSSHFCNIHQKRY